MTRTFTPGPWHLDKPFAEPGLYIAGPTTELIALVYENDQHPSYPPSVIGGEANARLIAAAPEMHDEGHKLAMLVLQSDLYQQNIEARECVDTWLALLAKIEGE